MLYSKNAALTPIFKQALITGVTSDGTTGEITLADGEKVAFDYAILGTGSSYGGIKSTATTLELKSDRLISLTAQKALIEAAESVVVVGGGSVGVEVAAAVSETFPGKKVTLLASGSRLLERFDDKASEYATTWLSGKGGVEIKTGERVVDWGVNSGEINEMPAVGTVKTASGGEYSGLIFKCLGVKANTGAFAASLAEKLTPQGAIVVNSMLQVEGMSNVFAAGDVAATSEEKTANYADYAGLAAANNVRALIYGKEVAPFPAALFKGQDTLPFASGASLGRKDGVMQMGPDVQFGSAISKMKGFFTKMMMGSVAGSWIWGPMFRFIKGMFSGQLAGLAKKAKDAAAAAAAAEQTTTTTSVAAA